MHKNTVFFHSFWISALLMSASFYSEISLEKVKKNGLYFVSQKLSDFNVFLMNFGVFQGRKMFGKVVGNRNCSGIGKKTSFRTHNDCFMRLQEAPGRAKGSKLDATQAPKGAPRRVQNQEKANLIASKLADLSRGISRVPLGRKII